MTLDNNLVSIWRLTCWDWTSASLV